MTIRERIKNYWQSKEDRRLSHPIRAEALVVEDLEDEANFISTLLQQQDVDVTRVRTIAGALEQLNGPKRFHLAFVDLELPNGSGLEVVRRIRDGRRHTHVIVMPNSLAKIPLVLTYGYVGLLSKPYTINSIGEILWKHRLHCNTY